MHTLCPGSSDPFYVVSCYMEEWKRLLRHTVVADPDPNSDPIHGIHNTVCPGSSDPFYVVTYFIKWVTTSWTYCI